MADESETSCGKTLLALAEDLEKGRINARGLVEGCFARIADPGGEGRHCFMSADREKALDLASASDAMRRYGAVPSPLAGVPVSAKDLFDVAGEATSAGSMALADSAPAARDAVPIARLRAAGAIFIGRNTMTEFAYSGVGINPHYGTPANPWDRQTGRIPGGSTSGGAVAVADGMTALAIGTDTGGSCRIPAALCGVVGFKPTASRIPLTGVFPLSKSLDSVGAFGRSVACVALADAVMAGEPAVSTQPLPIRRLRLAIPRTLVFDGIDEPVSKAFEASVQALRDAGAEVEYIDIAVFDALPSLADRGGIVAVEALAIHRERIAERGETYDPRVRGRIEMAASLSGADYVALVERRAGLIAEFGRSIQDYDALMLPTVPIVAPPFSAFEADDEYIRLNRLLLRNPSCFNLLDGCAISLPCHAPGSAPVGLMLAASHGRDKHLLRIAASVEHALISLRNAR